jgi:hypothetical protein
MEHHKCGCVTYYDPLADGYEYAEVCDEHWAAKYDVDYDLLYVRSVRDLSQHNERKENV